MNSNDMKKRTFEFAIAVARFLMTVPKSQPFIEYSRQLARCSGSVGANYRAACRAKSRKDFIYKLTIVEEEGDESMYWLEIFKTYCRKGRGT
jgi:four helix bundle protein